MLLTRPLQEAIRDGRVDLVFRRWRKPTVKAGGGLRTGVGVLSILSVGVVEPATITDSDAQRAGYTCADDLRADLFRQRRLQARGARPTESSLVYRVEVAFAGDDDRAQLRATVLTPDELAVVLDRLAAMDRRSHNGPWVERVLGLIESWPARRAPELAEIEGRETAPFKADVRRLKELGLTESLPVGYLLAPRGVQVLAGLRSRSTQP